MFKKIIEICETYIWFIKESQDYMGCKNNTFLYKIKIFLQSLYKGFYFCWISYFLPKDTFDEKYFFYCHMILN